FHYESFHFIMDVRYGHSVRDIVKYLGKRLGNVGLFTFAQLSTETTDRLEVQRILLPLPMIDINNSERQLNNLIRFNGSRIRWEKNITLGEPPGFLHSWW
ncbi:hypothetical protein L9F63_003744, partial [Diploptera punctata]